MQERCNKGLLFSCICMPKKFLLTLCCLLPCWGAPAEGHAAEADSYVGEDKATVAQETPSLYAALLTPWLVSFRSLTYRLLGGCLGSCLGPCIATCTKSNPSMIFLAVLSSSLNPWGMLRTLSAAGAMYAAAAAAPSAAPFTVLLGFVSSLVGADLGALLFEQSHPSVRHGILLVSGLVGLGSWWGFSEQLPTYLTGSALAPCSSWLQILRWCLGMPSLLGWMAMAAYPSYQAARAAMAALATGYALAPEEDATDPEAGLADLQQIFGKALPPPGLH